MCSPSVPRAKQILQDEQISYYRVVQWVVRKADIFCTTLTLWHSTLMRWYSLHNDHPLYSAWWFCGNVFGGTNVFSNFVARDSLFVFCLGNYKYMPACTAETQWRSQDSRHVQISATRLICVKLDTVCFEYTMWSFTFVNFYWHCRISLALFIFIFASLLINFTVSGEYTKHVCLNFLSCSLLNFWTLTYLYSNYLNMHVIYIIAGNKHTSAIDNKKMYSLDDVNHEIFIEKWNI